MRVDLITGFLGSGKTTFIRNYLKYLQKKECRIRIIENEFGAVNIDTRLLQDMTEEIDDLAGYCMCCTGKEKFVCILIEAGKAGYDRVIVEPSGIYDVDEFFSVMNRKAVADVCEIGNILTIVDASAGAMPEGESGYLMYAQLLAAGEIVLSKTQLCGDGQAGQCIGNMKKLVHDMDPEAVFDTPVCTADWDTLTDEDFARLEKAGYHHNRHKRFLFDHGAAYGTYMTAGNFQDEKDLVSCLKKIFEDPDYGEVLRVKGYLRDREKNWFEVNCTRGDFSVRPVQIRRGLAVVIGQRLNEQKLKETLNPGGRI